MTPKRIGRHLEGGSIPDDERASRKAGESLREVFSMWVSGVTIVAMREASKVHALTVSAFMPLSVDPPLVLVSLGPNASVLPFLDPGTEFAVSVLDSSQGRLASRFADVFPVGPSPFVENGPPVVNGCLAALVCTVDEVRPAGDHYLVVGRVAEARVGADGSGVGGQALAYFRRAYHPVGLTKA